MGTIISPRHLERIEGKITRRKRGNILTGGERMHGVSALDGYNFTRGCFFPPTVINDITVKDELWQDEIFGPVVVVVRSRVSSSVSS
jgi:acyl-CoA reductase-like NAD-dependent aldehyde dehydrogenase